MSSSPPDPAAAREALAQAAAAGADGLREGVYPHWVAALTALWAGGVTWLILTDSGWVVPASLAGIGFLLWRRHRAGATVREVRGLGDLFLALFLVLLLVGFVIGGAWLAAQRGWSWGPAVISAGVTLTLYLVMAIAHGRSWAAQARARKTAG